MSSVREGNPEIDGQAARDVPTNGQAPNTAPPAAGQSAGKAAPRVHPATAGNPPATAEQHPVALGKSPEALREAELFRQAQAGDRGAFGQVAIGCQDRLYNALLRIVGDRDEARELAQETFVHALAKIDSFRGDSQPYTWLFRIGMNLAISHIRKVRRVRVFSLDRPGDPRRSSRYDSNGYAGDAQASGLVDRLRRGQPPPSAGMEQRETAQQVLTALGKLDVEYRAILVMRDIDDLPYQDMADQLNLPLGTLKSRLFRARRALREELLAGGEDGPAERAGDGPAV